MQTTKKERTCYTPNALKNIEQSATSTYEMDRMTKLLYDSSFFNIHIKKKKRTSAIIKQTLYLTLQIGEPVRLLSMKKKYE